jgi:hypothetical protein
MNTLKKMTVATVLGVVTLGSTAFVCAEAPQSTNRSTNQGGLNVSAAMAAVDRQVACDVSEQMRTALEAPRTARVRQSPSVSITEVADVVVVAATRLPSLDPIEVARATSAQARL